MHYGIPAKIVNIINQSSWRVEAVTYLGSIIDKQGGTDAKARTGQARAAFLQLKIIWDCKELTLCTKV